MNTQRKRNSSENSIFHQNLTGKLRYHIENDLFHAESSPDFLSACSSFLQLRLQEKLGEKQILESDVSQSLTEEFSLNTNKKFMFSQWDESTTILNFSDSCIHLKNVDKYAEQFENEVLNITSVLHMDQILQTPRDHTNKTNFFENIKSKSQNNFFKFIRLISNMFNHRKPNYKSYSNKFNHEYVTTATQTEKTQKYKSKWTTTMKQNRISEPERRREYKKKKYNSETKDKRQMYYQGLFKQCEMSNSCMVVHTKVKTKKVKKINKLKKQNSKLSVCNEQYDSDDEFESYWNKVKNKKSRKH